MTVKSTPVLELAAEVLKPLSVAHEWLSTPNIRLGKKTPAELLNYPTGVEFVRRELLRLQELQDRKDRKSKTRNLPHPTPLR